MKNNECIADCGNHFFATKTPNVCNPCHVSCLTCSGALANQCLSCSSGTFLNLNKECVSDCGVGFYGDTSDNKCKSCDSTCHTCNGPLNN